MGTVESSGQLGRFRPYPQYKDSSIEGLASIPTGWSERRLKFVANQPIRNGVGEAAAFDDPDWPRYVRITDIAGPRSLRTNTFRSLPPDIANQALLAVGDILLAAVGATYGKSYLHANNIGPACFAGFLVKFSPAASLDPSFAGYWTESGSYWDQVRSRVVQATIQNFSAAKYKGLMIPFPPKDQQEVIAKCLDYETEKIDALIDKQQQLIALLKEKRQAAISHAVTKGLNPDVPMCESGVEWFGRVPKHWELRRLSHECDFESGKAHEPFVDDGGEFICVNSRFVSTQGIKRKFCTQNLTPAQVDDVLMVMSDLPNGRALARAFFVGDNSPYAVNQRVCIVRARRACPKFLFYLLDRNQHFLQQDDGVNQTHLSNSAFKKCPILIPPLAEQVNIVKHLDDTARVMDELIEGARALVTLLEERRTALISAAVTGKIDVRDWKAPESKAEVA